VGVPKFEEYSLTTYLPPVRRTRAAAQTLGIERPVSAWICATIGFINIEFSD
jgi:hypothetical protein